MEVALGFIIAAAIALTGVGGGVLTAPALILVLGLPAAESVGTALLFVAAVKSVATPSYIVRRQVNFRVLMRLLAGGIPGVLAGSLLLKRASDVGLGGVVLSIVGLTVLLSAALGLARLGAAAGTVERMDRRKWLPAMAAGIGLEVGFSSAGAGALGTTALLHCTKLSPAEVVGTDLLFGFVLSVVGGGVHFAAGAYNSAVLTNFVIGGFGGAIAGAYFASRLPARALRTALLITLAFVGFQLSYQGLRTLAGVLTK